MRQDIERLDDARAKSILAKIAATLKEKGLESEWAPGLAHALRDAFGAAPGPQPVSEGEVARQALILLSEDPGYREAILSLIQGPPPERFGTELVIALAPAVLLVLQTHVRIRRDKAGKWDILIEKKPTQAGLLKELISKLLSWIDGN